MKAVHFGAGNIGRGFLGQLYWNSGYETIFVDIDQELVRLLNERGRYTVHIVGPEPHDVEVGHVRGVDARETDQAARDVASCDLASIAAGSRALPKIAGLLAKGVAVRARNSPERPLNVIICENLLDVARILREHLIAEVPDIHRDFVRRKVGLVESVVSRMVPVVTEEQRRRDPLAVYAEEYCILPVDAKAFVGKIPQIVGMEPIENLRAYEERKLYTHNCGHALTAYFGFERGYAYIWESIEDREVRSLVEEGLWESGGALIAKHGFAEENYRIHVEQLLARFANRPLGDTIARVGRDPLRKLGPNERLVGAARLALAYGIEPRVLSMGMASALRYRNSDDPGARRLAEMLQKEGVDFVLGSVCNIQKGDPLYRLVHAQLGTGQASERGRNTWTRDSQ